MIIWVRWYCSVGFGLCFPHGWWCWVFLHCMCETVRVFSETSVQIIAHLSVGLFAFLMHSGYRMLVSVQASHLHVFGPFCGFSPLSLFPLLCKTSVWCNSLLPVGMLVACTFEVLYKNVSGEVLRCTILEKLLTGYGDHGEDYGVPSIKKKCPWCPRGPLGSPMEGGMDSWCCGWQWPVVSGRYLLPSFTSHLGSPVPSFHYSVPVAHWSAFLAVLREQKFFLLVSELLLSRGTF